MGWRRCTRGWGGGLRAPSRGAGRWRTCGGCWARWSARTAGSSRSTRASRRRTGCSGCWRRADWDADAVRDDLRAYVVEHLGDRDGVLVVDETGLPEEGHEVGRGAAAVQRHGRADRELPDRRVPGLRQSPRAAPSSTASCTCPRSGRTMRRAGRRPACPRRWRSAPSPSWRGAMLERALAAGVPAAWVTGDEVYGGDGACGVWLEEQAGRARAGRASAPSRSGSTTERDRAGARRDAGRRRCPRRPGSG